jgi:CRISPR-associated protein Cmr1
MLQLIKFECEIITPLFLGGADGVTPELRPPSIKGALRFWWRAMHPHLNLEQLKRKEDKIFGGGGEEATRSKIILQCSHPQLTTTVQNLVIHKTMPQKAFQAGQTFYVSLRMMPDPVEGFGSEQMQALFEITCLLGGLGKRSRRGRGSIAIKSIQHGTASPEDFAPPLTCDEIYKRLKLFSPHFQVANQMIINTLQGRTESYPFIQRIQIGKPNNNLLANIDKATHDLLGEYGDSYGASMGQARGGRFASPVYTTVLKDASGGLRPLITTLKTIPPRNSVSSKEQIQDEFRSKIL